MVKSAMLGLPMSLDGVAKALNLEQQKMAAGRALRADGYETKYYKKD